MASGFTTANTIDYGRGAMDSLGSHAADLADRAMLVSGRGSLIEAGVIPRAVKLLEAAGLVVVEFEGVGPDPDLATVDGIRTAIRSAGAEVVVAVGGGSVIDAAKAAAGLAGEEAPAAEFQAGRQIELWGIPNLAVPTTAGTGAEVTPNAVITDPDVPAKKSIRHPSFMPAVAIVDPELLVTLPARLTAESGMDALVQAIESATSIHATELTRALSVKAAALLARSLPKAVEDGDDLDARDDCAMGSLMAGMALASARLGVIHGIAHPLGARYGLPHGLVCGVLLPPALRLNAEAADEIYLTIEHVCHVETAGESAGERLAGWAEGLLAQIGLPNRFDDAKIPKGEFQSLAEESMDSGSLKANPLTIVPEHLVAMLTEVC